MALFLHTYSEYHTKAEAVKVANMLKRKGKSARVVRQKPHGEYRRGSYIVTFRGKGTE